MPAVCQPKSNATPSVPVHVVGGFLGSGKSTLLARLLAHELAQGSRPGVVMNEMGSFDVDGRILHDCSGGELDVHTLVGGCICCDLSEDLSVSIRRLLDETAATRLFVETTGLAEVGPVVDGVRKALVPENGGRRGELASVVLVVDASRHDELLATLGPRLFGLRDVTAVVINKLDLAGPGAAAEIARRVRSARPGAKVFRAVRADVPPEAILSPASRRLLAPSGEAPPAADSTRGFSNVSCRIEIPVDLPALEKLLRRFGSVYRAKGLVRVEGREGFHELQWVPPSLEAHPYPAEPPEMGELVVIGRRVPWDRFFRGLEACLVRPPRSRAKAKTGGRRG